MKKLVSAFAGIALSFAMAASAAAQQPSIKIGLILEYTGQFADPAVQLDNGIKLFLKQRGNEVAGRKVEILRRDAGAGAPDVAKRLAQELVVRDGADILAGFLLTPDALGAGDVSAQAKKFTVVMNAATSTILAASPFMARTSVTALQLNDGLGQWAAANGMRRVYTIAADYSPGHEAQEAFVRSFTRSGGKVVGSDFTPVDSPDFSAFVRRAKNADPDAVYVFVPGGAQPPAIGKTLAEQGVTPPKTRVLGPGALTSDDALASMRDAAIGIITATHYDAHLNSQANNDFVAAYRAEYGRNPDSYSIGGYDGMQLIFEALKKTGGNADGQALIDAAKGLSWQSPRGPVAIDAQTREINQTIYIYEVQKVAGALANVEIGRIGQPAKAP